MPQTDITMALPAPEDLEQFLDGVEEENEADSVRRTSRELLYGLLAIPVLFAGLVASIVWVVPVVTTWLPVALEYLSLLSVG